MLLKRLTEYAEAGRIPNMAPAGYLETPVRYVIDLDEDGHFVAIIDQAQGNTGRAKRGKPTFAPHVGRAYAIRPKLLADNAEYALGIPRDAEKSERCSESHTAFVDLLRACAAETQDPTVTAVLCFLNDGADLGNNLPADFDPSMTVTFRVGEVLPIDRPAVRA
ncbi:MAG TPA: type I-C CRISPR-associated protein Cas8c/Csd1, partial [Chloroflexota bacterium]|nr:type I-C CRISPR-associated protein Cas8c/Csd1 [Chloroflexota bacterium]